MRVLAFALLVAAFVRHESAFWLAEGSGFTPQAVNYMLGGAYEAVLAGTIAVLVWGYPRSLWKNLLLGAMAIAVLESAQIVGCRLALKGSIMLVPRNVNLCDYIAGFPVGQVMFSLYLLILVFAIGKSFSWARG